MAGGEGEREAARRVETWLRELGLAEVEIGCRVASRPRRGGTSSRCTRGSRRSPACSPAWIGFPLVALVTASRCDARQRCGGSLGLSRWAAPRASRGSSFGRAQGPARPRRRIVLCASLDAPPMGASGSRCPALARLLGRSGARADEGRAAGIRGLALARAARGRLCGHRRRGARRGWRGRLATLRGRALAAGLGGLAWLRIRFRARGCGARGAANPNASGVAALLTCGEQLLAQLRARTRAAGWWRLAANEVGGLQAGARLPRRASPRGADARRTLFLHFDRVGGCEPPLGARRRSDSSASSTRRGSPSWRAASQKVAAFGEVCAVDSIRIGTAAALAAGTRSPTRSRWSRSNRTAARSNEARASDLPEALDMAGVVRAADFRGRDRRRRRCARGSGSARVRVIGYRRIRGRERRPLTLCRIAPISMPAIRIRRR